MIDLCERCHEPLLSSDEEDDEDRVTGFCHECSETVCHECEGTGEASAGEPCEACDGTGEADG